MSMKSIEIENNLSLINGFTLLPCPVKSRPTSGDCHDHLHKIVYNAVVVRSMNV